jgi:hypothetical protein
VASIDKFDAANIPFPPHHVAVPCRFEAIEGQIEFEGDDVKGGGMKPGSPIVEVDHHAGVDAANAVEVKHCELIDLDALQGPTFNHRNISQRNFGQNLQGNNPAETSARRISLKVRPANLLKLALFSCPLPELE